jgi:hypothetical protein
MNANSEEKQTKKNASKQQEKEKMISNSMTHAVYLPIEISSSSRNVIAVCS